MRRSAHILGAGGIGIAVAESLMQAGWQVTLVESHPAKLEAARHEGVTLEGRPTRRPDVQEFRSWHPPADTPVLLCTKTFDNPAVLDRFRSVDRLVPVQNGYDPLLERQPHPGEAIASFVSTCPADRPVARITRPGDLHIGPRRPCDTTASAHLDELADALSRGGLFRVHRVESVRPFKATKLMYNAAISPLAAAAGVDNAALITEPLARRLFFALLKENHRILRHAGERLERIGPFHPDTVMRILATPLLPRLLAAFFRPSLRGTYCSMRPDMGSGRTEVDAYNGHLLRLAGSQPAPINRAVLEMEARISMQRLEPSREHLRSLAATLPRGVA
jgi:2-dehydropantoate 2-reductase